MLRILFSTSSFFFSRKKSIEQLSYYSNRFDPSFKYSPYTPTTSIANFLKHYSAKDVSDGCEHKLCGRVSAVRKHGKTTFIDLRQQHIRLQLASKQDEEHIRRGDIVGVRGKAFVTNKGELSLLAQEITMVAPCLWMLPEYNSLKDHEVRYRHKHLDLITNEESMRKLKMRSKIISTLRRELEANHYIEVETPILAKEAGGAIAKPFQTYHLDHKIHLRMRIAPELYLKKLLVGGFLRVFQIGKNFRNQSIDQTHNPQFTSCELYCAYSNYTQMLTFTKTLLCNLIKQVLGVPHGKLTIDNEQIDFEAQWQIIDFIRGLEQKLKQPLPSQFTSQQSRVWLDKICSEREIECDQPRSHSRLLDKLAGKYLQCVTKQPLVLINHPRCMSPLAQTHEDRPHLTQRFELFVNGWELVNAYTELNDPRIQIQNTPTEHDFVEALEYGLVPCAGWGMGVDRFVMLLTNAAKIQEVIAFPLLKNQQ